MKSCEGRSLFLLKNMKTPKMEEKRSGGGVEVMKGKHLMEKAANLKDSFKISFIVSRVPHCGHIVTVGQPCAFYKDHNYSYFPEPVLWNEENQTAGRHLNFSRVVIVTTSFQPSYQVVRICRLIVEAAFVGASAQSFSMMPT